MAPLIALPHEKYLRTLLQNHGNEFCKQLKGIRIVGLSRFPELEGNTSDFIC